MSYTNINHMKFTLTVQQNKYVFFVFKSEEEIATDQELKDQQARDISFFTGTIDELRHGMMYGLLDGITLHKTYTHITIF